MRIALVGKMRSGKDTVASLLLEKGFTQIAFGDGIREIVAEYFPEALLEGKPRSHYQKIGQWLRELNNDVWINYVDRKSKDWESVLVSDCRQLNEAKYLRDQGYMILKVYADDEVRKQRIIESGETFSPELFNHETEQQVDSIEYDLLLINNGTLEELKRDVALAFMYYKNYFLADQNYRKLLEEYSYGSQG